MCPIASVAHIEIDVIPKPGLRFLFPSLLPDADSFRVIKTPAFSAVISDAEPRPELNSQVGAIARL